MRWHHRLTWIVPALMVCGALRAEMVTQRLGTPPAAPAPAKGAHKGLPARPVVYVPATAAPPKVTGRIDDPAWAKAATINLERTLDGAASAPQPTQVRLLRDEKSLYVGFRCSEPQMSRLKAEVREHDGEVYADDSIEMFVGTPGGAYYHFAVNAAGSTFDAKGKGDASWSSGFKAVVGKGASEWNVEMAIPLAGMFTSDVPKDLVGNFHRNRHATGSVQETAWSPTGSDDSHVPGRFGKLVFGEPPVLRAETPAAPAARKGPVTILPAAGGEGVAVFDLSDLPRNAKVYRADLLVFRTSQVTGADDDAMVDIQILPLTQAVKPGEEPKPSGKPLALRGPWLDRFDATEAVRAWAGGKTNGGFFFKVCPRWNAEGSCLEVAYEGKADTVPPQVKDVKAFHRAGQTFIAWKEVDPLIAEEKTTYGQVKAALAADKDACRYRIYASSKPIDAKSVAKAEVIAEVGPLSAYNVNGRCPEYLYGEALVKSDQMGELAEDYNGRMYQWGMDSPRMDRFPVERFVIDERAGRLPVGTGLYVHTPAAPGKRYYAVLACKDGVENGRDLSPANAVGAVEEIVGPGEPVCQGEGLWGPYFDYPGKRYNYVQWCGPPLAPRPGLYFNWSVMLPPKIDTPRPVELYFHAAAYSYAKPNSKFLLDSIQIAAHDYPPSGWYGYNDAWGTLKSFRAGVVGNHTQRRIIAFLEWAKKKFPIDADRILASGGDGAAALALNYPDMFAYVLITGFEAGTLNPKAAGAYEAVWGKKSPDIKDDLGRADWSWSELDKLVLAHPERDLPMFHCGSPSWGVVPGYARGEGRFYDAMRKTGQAVSAGWSWNYKLVPPNRFDDAWRGLDINRRTPIPAFANSGADKDTEADGHTNMHYQWRDVKDAAEGFEITVTGPDSTFDLVPRRCRNFKPRPGEKLAWTADCPAKRDAAAVQPQAGTVSADPRGLVTIRGVRIANGSVTIKVARAK